MKKITVQITTAQASALAWALALGLTAPGARRMKKSLAIIALRIADEIERVFPGETS